MFKTLLTLCLAVSSCAFADVTFSMVKPSAVKDNEIGAILDQIECAGYHLAAIRMTQMTPEQAKVFYKEHEGKPFFDDLVQKMTSGPVVAFVVEGKDVQKGMRKLVGATDPAKAEPYTIRALFGKSASENAIHASDSPEAATREIALFFKPDELFLNGNRVSKVAKQ